MRGPVAIVGMAGLFPGARSLEDFWQGVVGRRDASRVAPANRWLLDAESARARTPAEADKVASTRGYFLDDDLVEGDAELAKLDPLCRIVVATGRRAWAAARTERVDRKRAGVILANIALPTEGASRIAREVFGLSAPSPALPRFVGEGVRITQPLDRYVTALPAGLLARALGLGLASYTLDAACASSLYAIALACDELLAGRADCFLAGGASRPDPLYTQMGFSQLRALSPTGRCSPFDRRGDGLVVGEGAGVFVLKRLADAVAHGDKILGVIRGVGLSNDVGGKLLAPDSEGQLRAMRKAYEQAGWKPTDVDLIECHATGTPVGDAVELASLRALWGEDGWRDGQCVLGAVKACVGHLLTGAGAAGLAKTLLALAHETLPPQTNFERPAPGVTGPFRLLKAAEPWKKQEGRPRRAAVSGFGFGGINAHLLVEEFFHEESRKAGEESFLPSCIPHEKSSPIAIVGMEARFSGLKSLRAFQEAVLSGTSALRARPADRWRGLEQEQLGGWLDPIEISPGELRIPPNELPELLPQQLLMLQCAKRALEDAKLPVRERRLKAGVIVGLALDLNTTNFHLRWAAEPESKDATSPALNATRTLGALGGLIASRIARELELGGPSFGVSGEECSGLRALEVAARLLQKGELDLAVAGGVDLAGDARAVLGSGALKPWSKTAPRPFDAAASGSVPGEGAAALVLKRLEDAERDGDRIYAILRGVGAASDYEHALDRAYEDAGVEPATVSFVAAHGSGHRDEDAIEARALATRFHGAAIGSVKPIVGHAGAASGLASLVTASLSLFQEVLPPLPGFEKPAAALGDLHVPRTPLAWLRDRKDGPRRAGVSALSVDGSFVHVVLEGRERAASAHAVERRQPLGARSEALFAVEADDASGLIAKLDELLSLPREAGEGRGGGIEKLARRWFAKHGSKPAAKLAVAIIASDTTTLARRAREAREAVLAGRVLDDRNVRFTPKPAGGPVAFVFPGSGNHYVGMGRGLGVEWPEVVRALDDENERLASQLMPRHWAPYRASWERGWEDGAAAEVARDPHRMIFGQVTHGVTVSDVVRRFVKPEAAIGYSLGESTSLFALRAWRDRDAMLARMLASPLFKDELAGRCEAARRKLGIEAVDWKVVLVNRSAADTRRSLQGAAWVLIGNAPDECVVGGLRADVERTVKALGAESWALEGVPTVHCPVVEAVEPAYRALHRHRVTPPEGVRYYSGALAASYELSTESAAESVTAQALRGFDFPALIERAYADGLRVFVECGPQGSCTRAIAKILGARPHVAVTACVRGQEERTTILRLLARLIAERVPVDLHALYGEETLCTGHRDEPTRVKGTIVVPLDLPPLPIQRQRATEITESTESAESVAAVETLSVSSVTSVANPFVPFAKAEGVFDVARATAAAHETYLATAQRATQNLARGFALQAQILEALAGTETGLAVLAPPAPPRPAPKSKPEVFLDREQCLEFARGAIGKVLGAKFAPFDAHPTRVRLPDEPLMLCDRMISVEGEPLSLKSGRLVTEHDVLEGAWYLDAGRAPVCISVEAGQADLFLSAYLGIDRETKGERRYRLLDAVVTFHRSLPRVGETIRYDIRIDRFVKQGSTYLFFFNFDGTVNGEKLVTMREGCAGFFSQEQLDHSAGIVLAPGEEQPAPRGSAVVPGSLAPMRDETLTATQIEALRAGDLAAAFGADFASLPLRSPVRLPGADGSGARNPAEGRVIAPRQSHSRMHLIDRVVALEPRGGQFGLGLIRAEADVRPDDWYLTCHFVDDMVMPGTLMYECCLHTLRVFLTRLGWTGEEGAVGHEPVRDNSSRLRCRGQVTQQTKVVAYEIHLKELGYAASGEPYAIADALMFADGKRIVRMENMSVRLEGLTQEKVEALWRRPLPGPPPLRGGGRPAFERERITAFAIGKPSDAFGDRYRVFDSERKIARLPGPPFQLLDRIMDVSGAKAWELAPTDWIEGEYDVPRDAWYFGANRQASMPFSVLLEIALQPCGWLAAYCGSALRSATDLSFRNLGGTAVMHEELFTDAGTLTTRVRLTSFSEAGGMIIQKYDMKVLRGTETVYEGDTSFGFFSKAALAQQVGVRGAKPWVETRPLVARALPDRAPFPEPDYRMVDEVAVLLDGGPEGKGFVRGTTTVDPARWFFKAHFYEDPVWPGSLGLESFLQLLKCYLAEKHPALLATHRFETILPREPHEWAYRGQIVPKNKKVTVEAVIDEHRENGVVASGFLSVDGIVIYEIKKFGLRLVR